MELDDSRPFLLAPIELNTAKYWDFFELLLIISTKLNKGEKPSDKEYKDFFNCIYFDEKEIAWQYFMSLSYYKDPSLEYNIGSDYSEQLHKLILTHKPLKKLYPSFEEFVNSDLGLFIYLFINVYGLFSRLLNHKSNHSFSIYALIINHNFILLENPNNAEELMRVNYQKQLGKILTDVIKLSFKNPKGIEEYYDKELTDFSNDELIQLGQQFIPFKENVGRLVKYLDIRLNQFCLELRPHALNVLNGFICSLIDLLYTESLYEEMTKEENRIIRKRKTDWFPGSWKDYLVKYEIEKRKNSPDKFKINITSWLDL